MATGDTTNPERVRLESNERLDLVDLDAGSRQTRLLIDAFTRALVATSRAAAGSTVGFVFTGGALVANPTGPSDGKVRVASDLLVALDADDRCLIKPAATTIDAVVPAGGAQYQIYLYFVENPANLAKRRAIPVVSPFTEFTILPNTMYKESVGVYVRAGGLGSVVPSDVVNGLTVNLCLLGIASNVAGTVTVALSTSNRISTIAPPTTTPASSTDGTSSVRTLADLGNVAAYEIARAKYRETGTGSGSTASIAAGASFPNVRVTGLSGMTAAMVGGFLKLSGAATAGHNGIFEIVAFVSSTVVDLRMASLVTTDANNGALVWSLFSRSLPGGVGAPGAANNYGFYVEPRRGLDAVDRSTFAITIGDGVSTFGTFDRTQFVDDSELLRTALTFAAAHGGEIVLKEGVNLNTFGTDVTVSGNNNTIKISSVESSIISLGGRTLTLSSGKFLFSNLSIFCTAAGLLFSTGAFVSFDRCSVQWTTAGAVSAIIGDAGLPISRFVANDCSFTAVASGADNPSVPLISLTAGVSGAEFIFTACRFAHILGSARSMVSIEGGGNNIFVRFSDCKFSKTGSSSYATEPYFISVNSLGLQGGAAIVDCAFSSSTSGASNFFGVDAFGSSNISVQGCLFDHVFTGVRIRGLSLFSAERISVQGCRFVNDGATNVLTAIGVQVDVDSIVDFNLLDCFFSNNKSLQMSVLGILDLTVRGCTFFSSTNELAAPAIAGSTTTADARVIWSDNYHSGFRSLLFAEGAFGVSITASALNAVVANNKFYNLQQGGAYSGPIVSPGPAIVKLAAAVQSWSVTGNVATRCGAMSSGSPTQMVFLFVTHNVPGWNLESGALSGNSIGDEFSKICLAQTGSPFLRSLVISNNSLHTLFPNVVVGLLQTRIDSTAVSGNLSVCNNSFVLNGSGGDTYPHMFFLGDPGGAGVLTNLSFLGNSLLVAGTFNTDFGVSYGPVVDLFVHSNSAASLSAAGPPIIFTAGPAPTNFNQNGVGSFPASGSAFPNNINFERA